MLTTRTASGGHTAPASRMLLIIAGLLLAVFAPYYLLTLDLGGPMPRDGTGLVVGRDFLNFWFYGRAAWSADPGRFYDLPTYWRAVEQVAGKGYPGQQWSYPPTVLLIAAPFGRLPYLAALLLWTIVGIGLFVAALRLWTRDRWLILVVTACPAALFGIMSGQLAYVAAAAILAVLRWRIDRPVLTGVLLGLLTLKPQLGVVFPVLLLATRSWRVIAVAALTAGLLVGTTVILWGPELWSAYRLGLGHQSAVLTDPLGLATPFMATIFMNVRSAHGPIALAAMLQGVTAAIAAVVVWLHGRGRPPADSRSAVLLCAASAAAMPYLMSYDTLALAAVAALLLVRATGPRMLLLLAFVLPLLQMALGHAGVPGPALVPLLLALTIFRPGAEAAAST